MPLFMFACLKLFTFMEIYELSIEESMKLYEEIRIATTATGAFDVKLKDDITLIKTYSDDNFNLATKYVAKPWNGYIEKNDKDDNEKSEATVYVTINGEAYHKSESCPYLKLSIHGENINSIDNQRNLNGGKYYRCDKCANEKSGLVFVTDYGELYHSSLECSHLKRTIIEINETDIGDRHACSKCMQK